MSSSEPRSTRYVSVILTVLWFGALWGAVEAVLGGALHWVMPPTWPGRVMILVAGAIMTYAIRRTGSAWMPLGMALVAAPLKLTSALVFALPVSAPAVLNPAFAILAEGLGLAVVAWATRRWWQRQPMALTLTGAGAGLAQGLVFVTLVSTIGLAVYPALNTLSELGTKFPHWVLSADATASYLATTLPWSITAAAVGAAVAALPPIRRRAARRPAELLLGSLVCLVVACTASFLF